MLWTTQQWDNFYLEQNKRKKPCRLSSPVDGEVNTLVCRGMSAAGKIEGIWHAIRAYRSSSTFHPR